MKTETKIEKVRKHLIKHKTITARDAVVLYDYYRLASGIKRLRDQGMNIPPVEMIRPKNGDAYGKYHYHEPKV